MKKLCFILLLVYTVLFTVFGQTPDDPGIETVLSSGSIAGTPDEEEKMPNAAVPQEASDDSAVGALSGEVTTLPADAVTVTPVEEENGTVGEVQNTPSAAAPTAEPDMQKDAAAVPVSQKKIAVQTEPMPEETARDSHDKLYTFQAAEVNEPTARKKRRGFSLHTGLTFSILAANNIFSVPDFFKQTLVIDFNKLAEKTIRSGIHSGSLVNLDWFFQFTVNEEHTVKFSTTVDARAWANIPKNILTLIAKGNADGKPIEGSVNGTASAFADTGIMYRLQKPSFGFSARVAYFVPLGYMQNPQAKYKIFVNDAGLLTAEGVVDTKIYGHLVGLAANTELNIAQLFKDGGLDLSLTGSYQPAGWVNIRAGVDYLPLMVVTLNKGIRNRVHFYGQLNNLFDAIGKQDSKYFTTDIKTDVLSNDLPAIKIMRPCKISLGADFKPFQNNYLILSPFVAIPVVNTKPFYMDGGLKIESRFAKVLGVSLETGYVERIWRHELALFLDSRWMTFTLAASLASHDFARTFTTISGAGVRLGIGIGF